jgi:predicted PurR-regulated permease PerM
MENKTYKRAFLVVLLALIAAFIAVVRPFLLSAFFALLLVIICAPIHKFLLKRLHKRYLAAFFATLFVALCVMAPLGIIVIVIISNFLQVSTFVTTQLQTSQFAHALDSFNLWVNANLSQISDLIPPDFNIRTHLLTMFTAAVKVLYQYSPKVLAATANIIGEVLLTIVFVFILFAEGARMFNAIFPLLPMEERHKDVLTKEIRFVVSATFLGMMATAVAQGILIGIGFWIAGISNPFVWGLVAIGVTLVPVIGGPLMYVPAAVSLIVSGHLGAGIFLLLYGVCIVSMIDNVIKPLAMRGKVNVHPLLLAFCLVGGGIWLGAVGIIIGPLIAALLLAMLRIYRKEFV